MGLILDHEDVVSGLKVAEAFWLALGRDDDAAVEVALMPEPLILFSAGAGLAARIRDHLGIEAEDCSRLRAMSPVTLCEDRRMRPVFMFPIDPKSMESQERADAWRIDLADGDAGWRIDPTTDGSPPEVAHRYTSLATV